MALGEMTQNLINAFNKEAHAHAKARVGAVLLGIMTCGMSCCCFYSPACGETRSCLCADDKNGERCCYKWPDQIPPQEQIQLTQLKTILSENLKSLRKQVEQHVYSEMMATKEEVEGIRTLLLDAQKRNLLKSFKSRDTFISLSEMTLQSPYFQRTTEQTPTSIAGTSKDVDIHYGQPLPPTAPSVNQLFR